jgi:SPP1 gp7 family putative phage head morphogenesis protein
MAKRTKGIKLKREDVSLRSKYRKLLSAYLKLINKDFDTLVFDYVKKNKNTDATKFKSGLLAAIKAYGAKVAAALTLLLPRVEQNLRKQNERNRLNFARVFSKETGKNLTNIFERRNTQAELELRIARNVDLITSLAERTKLNLTGMIIDQVSDQDFDARKIGKLIRKENEVSERRARYIVRDQTHKLLSTINQLRLENLGITHYRWRNSKDRRVRGNPNGLYPNARYNHWTREGKEYAFSNPPADGNPGIPYGCRCVAEPIVPVSFLD